MNYPGKIPDGAGSGWLLKGSLALTVLIIAVYWPVLWFDFIELDDNLYLLENPKIKLGLSIEGINWAMTTFHAANWHPLTWLFLLAEYDFFGLNPVGYHVVGVLLHIINTILLFIVITRIAKEKWQTITVAAMFAACPVNIESVAWIAEHKNLLSTMLYFMTILAYMRYVEKSGLTAYLGTVLLFALGLMAKPMLVSLPFVFLLLDYWPLERLCSDRSAGGNTHDKREKVTHLLMEKIPFFILSLFSVLVTIHAAHAGGAIKSLTVFPLGGRIARALVSYLSYAGMIIWPCDLSIFYPYAPGKPLRVVAAAFIFLSAAFGTVIMKGPKYRYLTVGWLWYLLTMLPVIGIVQVGFQGMANRYAYIPYIGIFIIIAMGLPDIAKRVSGVKTFLPILMLLPVLCFTICSAFELPHWRNSETAFTRALEVTQDNHIALLGMGNIDAKTGKVRAAEAKFRAALRIRPDYAEAHNNIALLLMKRRQNEEAEHHLRNAIKYDPLSAKACNNLGALLAGEKRFAEARMYFEKAIMLNPDYANARANLSLLMNVSERKKQR